jgi:hypothetical protein
VAADAVDETLSLLDIAESPFTTAEVADAANYLTGVAPLRYATAQGWWNRPRPWLRQGLGPSFVDENLQRLRDVTAEQATAATPSSCTTPCW